MINGGWAVRMVTHSELRPSLVGGTTKQSHCFATLAMGRLPHSTALRAQRGNPAMT
jgi:hypothetical protein